MPAGGGGVAGIPVSHRGRCSYAEHIGEARTHRRSTRLGCECQPAVAELPATRFAPGRCSYVGYGPGTRGAAGGEGLPHDAAPANPVYLAALTSLPLSSFMELVRGLHNLRSRHRGCVATIGNYDGVHAGHQAILKRLRAHATRVGLPGCVVIFEPQPREYFSPQSAPPRLTRLRDKLALLEEQGVDRVLCLAFNRRLRELSADEFIQQVLIDGLGVQHLEVGDDFRFGCDRAGDFNLLKQWGQRKGFTVESASTVAENGERVSSTRVRQVLADGDFAQAERLLGRPFSITGRVLHGQKLGRQLGAPTANVQL